MKTKTESNRYVYAYFDPRNTLHLSLPGFDTSRGIYAVNVSNLPHRKWDDSRKYGFVAVGHGRKYSAPLQRLAVGDIVAAFLAKHGYVGIGRVAEQCLPASEFCINGLRFSRSMLKGPELLHDSDDAEICEYLVKIEWIKTQPADRGQFLRKAGLFAPRPIVTSLSGQPKTLNYLEQQFRVNFEKLLAAD